MRTMLFTGASGFLGREIIGELRGHYRVTTLGRATSNDISVDLGVGDPQFSERYDVVLHAASRAHGTPRTAEERASFDRDIRLATINLCQALERVGTPRSFIFISTVSVYGDDAGEMVDETAPLRGISPYALAKIQAEQFLTDWAAEHNVKLTILRPALIIGANPPGNLGLMERAIRRRRYLNIARGCAKKSIVFASDIAQAAMLAEDRGGVYNLCTPEAPTVRQISMFLARRNNIRRVPSLPMWIARLIARLGDHLPLIPLTTERLSKLTTSLTFSPHRAQSLLSWHPTSLPQ